LETEKKEKKGGRRKLQNRYISSPRRGAISQPICTKFGEYVDLTDLITPAKFGPKIFIGFFQAERWIIVFFLYGLYNSAMRYRAGL